MLESLKRLLHPAAPVPQLPEPAPARVFPGLPAGQVPACVDFGRACHDHCACPPVRPRSG